MSGKADRFEYLPKTGGRLYLTVNDILGSENPRDREYWMLERDPSGRKLDATERNGKILRSYGPNESIEKLTKSFAQRWDEMLERRYWDVWIEDNVGYYMVTISVQPK